METHETALVRLIGDGVTVPTISRGEVPHVALDNAASTAALPAVAEAVAEFVPWYSSVHRGSGYKSRHATEQYEQARESAWRFAGADSDKVAIICRNTTEAINHLAYRLPLTPDDVILTTVVEHHANLLPWGRVATRRYVECGPDGTFTAADVAAAIDEGPRPALLAVTGASNVTGWVPPIDAIIEAAHERHVPVLVDAAQVAAHHPLPATADYLVWSGHKMYAPYGAGVLVGSRDVFDRGDPFLAGGGAVDLVDLDEVIWTDPPEREEAGSPNVVGAVALRVAIEELGRIGWDSIVRHEVDLSQRLRAGLAAIPGVRLLGPSLDTPTLALATFTVDDVHHALVAARLSAEFGIAVRHGCFCAHPYVMRLLDLSHAEVEAYRDQVTMGDRRSIPGAVRASAGISTTAAECDALLEAVAAIAAGEPAPVEYVQDRGTGDYWPDTDAPGWSTGERTLGGTCARG